MRKINDVLLGVGIFLLAIALAGCEPVEFQNYNIVTGWEETAIRYDDGKVDTKYENEPQRLAG